MRHSVAIHIGPDVPRRGALVLRPWTAADAGVMGAYWARNREHLLPTQPDRAPDFWGVQGQRHRIAAARADVAAGRLVPLLVLEEAHQSPDGGDRVLVGEVIISNIVRGAFQSCSIGYSIDAIRLRCGIATAAVGAAVDVAFTQLGLHRVQAGTLVDNVASQRVLTRLGFERIGVAAQYLQIAGGWRDHLLFQRIARDVL